MGSVEGLGIGGGGREQDERMDAEEESPSRGLVPRVHATIHQSPSEILYGSLCLLRHVAGVLRVAVKSKRVRSVDRCCDGCCHLPCAQARSLCVAY